MVAIGILIATIFFVFLFNHFPLQCPFKYITGIPCPGCGGSRALIYLLNGDIKEALHMNPLTCLILLCSPILMVLFFFDCIHNTQRVKNILLFKTDNKYIRYGIYCVLILNWIHNIYYQI